MKRLILLAALLFGAMATPALAGNCSPYPYTLVNGQVADANQVMSDFNTVRNCFINNGAANGSNSDIKSLNGLTTPLSVSQGGTGSSTTSGIAAGSLSPGGTISITGDLLYTSPAFTGANTTGTGTLATVNASPGTYANAMVTVNGKGLATTVVASPAASTTVQGPTTLATNAQVLTGTNTTNAVTPASLVSATIASPGYYKLPGGLIIQWGVTGNVIGNGGTASITYPTAFATATYSVVLTPLVAASAPGGQSNVGTVSTTGFSMQNGQNTTGPFYWQAVGQ